MHKTWEPGDPVIQLNFPNPLNVSVQVGDIAYFSNPTEVGLQVQSWTATTTPHLSNPQGGIMMIGEIIQIIPWDNTVSSIICQMPQVLFNQYFDQIVEGGCVSTPSGNPTCANPTFDPVEEIVSYEIIFGYFDFPSNEPFGCCNRIPGYSSTIAVPQTAVYTNIPGPQGFGWGFFFDNPTLSVHDYMLHRTLPETYAGNIAIPPSPLSIIEQNQWCLLQNDHPNYVPGHINFWAFYTPVFWTDENGLEWGPFITAGLLIDFLIGLYPTAGFFQGMDFWELSDVRSTIPGMPTSWWFGGGGEPLMGSYSDIYTETCTQGSFIMFSKDNKVNMSDMLGYYASVELRNNSKTEAELFNVGTTFFESSK